MRAQQLGAGHIAQSQSALPAFKLYRPASLSEATALLAQYPQATVAAGCSDLVAQFREGCTPEVLITLQAVQSLRTTSHEGGILRIGSLTTHHAGSNSTVISRAIPGLCGAWGSIATVRIRYRATLGGNLLSRRFRYELPVILAALDGKMHFDQGSTTSQHAVANLWETPKASGILTAVTVDTASLLWFGYERSMRPLTTIALAIRRQGAGHLTITAVCGSEYRQPFRLEQTVKVHSIPELDTRTLGAALAAQLPHEAGDYNGSIDYRRHLVSVLVGRMLCRAAMETEEMRIA